MPLGTQLPRLMYRLASSKVGDGHHTTTKSFAPQPRRGTASKEASFTGGLRSEQLNNNNDITRSEFTFFGTPLMEEDIRDIEEN